MKGAGLVVVAVLLLVVGLVHGSLLASSRVERCVRDGASDVPNISCDRRMIVTLTVDSGQVTQLRSRILHSLHARTHAHGRTQAN
jgi:hypothetical protein